MVLTIFLTISFDEFFDEFFLTNILINFFDEFFDEFFFEDFYYKQALGSEYLRSCLFQRTGTLKLKVLTGTNSFNLSL